MWYQQRERKQAEKKENTPLAKDENQYIYSCDKLVTVPTLAYC